MKRAGFLLVMAFMLSSCGKTKYVEIYDSYDFDKVYYQSDPFVGILSSRPEILVKSLEYPPYKWCLHTDTSYSEQLFAIDYNIDAVREPASTVNVIFTDSKGDRINDVSITVDGSKDSKSIIPLSALSQSDTIKIKAYVNSALQDTVISGFVCFETSDIDLINGNVSNEAHPSWRIQQTAYSNFWLYFLWILTLLLILLIIGLIIYGLVKLIEYSIPFIENWFGHINLGGRKQNGENNRDEYDEIKKYIEYVHLQDEEYGYILRGFKISKTERVESEAYLNGLIWWNVKDRKAAEIFCKKLNKFIQTIYGNKKETYRSKFIFSKLRNKNIPYVWINAMAKEHYDELTVVDDKFANEKDLKYFIYFPNTKTGYEHATQILDEINQFIRINWKRKS